MIKENDARIRSNVFLFMRLFIHLKIMFINYI